MNKADQNIFNKNLKALNGLISENQIERIREIQYNKDLFIQSKSGDLTLFTQGLYIHSKYNPLKEAEKLRGHGAFENYPLTVAWGFGLGYHIEAFFKKIKSAKIVLIEPSLPLFAQALFVKDFSWLFTSSRLFIYLSPNEKDLKSISQKFDLTNSVDLSLRSLEQINKESFTHYRESLKALLRRIQINHNTLNRFKDLWINNIFKNAPLLEQKPGIKEIKGAYRGLPALLIAAGPSLDLIKEQLIKLQDYALLVCVDTALKACLSLGLKPDFTISTDPQYWNTRHLDNCDTSQTILISDLSAYPSLFCQKEQRIFLSSTSFPLAQYLEEKSDIKGKLCSGGSVATAAWDFCRHLGCCEIFTIGLDLGYPQLQTHFKGATFEQRIHSQSLRLNSAETQTYNMVQGGQPFYTKNYFGEPLLSDQRMLVYQSWFQEQLALDPYTTTYNLSPQGVKIKGMDYISPEYLLEKEPIREKIEEINSKIKQIEPPFLPSPINRILLDLKESLIELLGPCEKGKELSSLLLKQGYNKAILRELNQIDQRIYQHENKEIIGFIIKPILEKILKEEQRDEKEFEEVINTSILFYSELSSSLKLHLKALSKVL